MCSLKKGMGLRQKSRSCSLYTVSPMTAVAYLLPAYLPIPLAKLLSRAGHVRYSKIPTLHPSFRIRALLQAKHMRAPDRQDGQERTRTPRNVDPCEVASIPDGIAGNLSLPCLSTYPVGPRVISAIVRPADTVIAAPDPSRTDHGRVGDPCSARPPDRVGHLHTQQSAEQDLRTPASQPCRAPNQAARIPPGQHAAHRPRHHAYQSTIRRPCPEQA